MPTNRPTTHPTTTKALSVALAVAVLATTPACRNRRQKADADKPTNAGLAALTGKDQAPVVEPVPDDGFEATRQQILQSAALLEQSLAGAETIPPSTPDSQPTPADPNAPLGRPGTAWVETDPTTVITDPAAAQTAPPETRFSLSEFAAAGAGEPASTPDNEPDTEPDPEPVPETAQTPVAAAEPLPVDPEQRKQELVDELVGVLTELARSGDAPGSAALALAGLEAVKPQALDTLASEGLLSQAELASLQAARQMLAALASEGGIADPGQVSGVLERIRQELDAKAGLRVVRSMLCTRVDGFGRYETFGANRFIAGKAQPVIVYTELDRFAHKESTGEDGLPRYGVELSQRLELYHTADDLNTWNRAAETDRTTSRNRLRDYYLINQVTLPANLTVGKYHLKVIMRDLVAGTTAEAIIPIEIVASTSARP
jgi:hypothetical protein